jgi:hypothetical protein
MAPEQGRGDPVDFRADIYALGATLFHLVSGKPPFEADTLDALLSKHASADRPQLPRRAGTPRTMIAAIDALVGRMMAPAPAARFASYDELIRAIELTSVEHMRPAGFWVRSIASFVDFLIVLLVALVIAAAVALTLRSASTDDVLSALLLPVYAAGAIALISRRGRTPGQSLFELEVVDTATAMRPAWRRAAIRVLVPVGVPLIFELLKRGLGAFGREVGGLVEVVAVIAGCAPLVLLLWASLRSVGKQTLWDRWSGTMVRYRSRRTTAI